MVRAVGRLVCWLVVIVGWMVWVEAAIVIVAVAAVACYSPEAAAAVLRALVKLLTSPKHSVAPFSPAVHSHRASCFPFVASTSFCALHDIYIYIIYIYTRASHGCLPAPMVQIGSYTSVPSRDYFSAS